LTSTPYLVTINLVDCRKQQTFHLLTYPKVSTVLSHNHRQAGDQAFLRQTNLSVLLTRLRQNAPISRAALAAMTGLNRATITRLVRELIEAGFVREIGLEPSVAGRPSILLELNPDAGYIIGGEIGVNFVSAVVTNFAAEILWRQHESTNEPYGQDDVLRQAFRVFQSAYDHFKESGRPLLGLGLGVPGLVDVSTGTLLFAPNLGWTQVPLLRLLESQFNIPAYVNNVASMSALGESYFGVARDYDYVFYLSTQGGLGGKIVLNGNILAGAAGFAGEVGHSVVDVNGRLCNCGRTGCWETVASQLALFHYVREAVASGQTSALIEATGGDLAQLTVTLIVEAASQGDAVARSALAEVARWLGLGLANIINALNPQRIVIGGALSVAQDYLLPNIKEVVAKETILGLGESCEIVIAAYGADACLMGGVATVYQHILNRPDMWTLAAKHRQYQNVNPLGSPRGIPGLEEGAAPHQ
jgi:glucokinase-like ROK family protein